MLFILSFVLNLFIFRVKRFDGKSFLDMIIVMAMIIVPAVLTGVQDAGTALVFLAFFIVLALEGMDPVPLLIVVSCAAIFFLVLAFGIGTMLKIVWVITLPFALLVVIQNLIFKPRINWKFISVIGIFGAAVSIFMFFVDFAFGLLKDHQQNRIKVLLDPYAYKQDEGFNVIQSMIAIGSGGFNGKGYLQGTQTQYNFVPEQETDFIFSTIGEEHGWLGALVVIGLYVFLIIRTIHVAGRQKLRYSRVYGLCVASVLFIHFFINIGMTIGLVPVIGIPLLMFSYGGSSLLAFSVFFFFFLNQDAHRTVELEQ